MKLEKHWKTTSRLLKEDERNKREEGEGAIAFQTTEKYCYRCKSSTHNTKFCKKGREDKKCYACGKLGHIAKNCFSRNTSESATSKNPKACEICKKTNHKEKNCFFRKKTNTSKNKVSFPFTDCENLHTQDFIVDSGSSSHMVNSKDLFFNLVERQSHIQVAKRNEKMTAEGKGSIETTSCVLNYVLFIPDLRRNLLSVNAITKNDSEVTFTKEKVVITKNDTKVLEGKKTENGLYVVKLNKTEETNLTEKKDKADVWHRMLGHLGLINMKKRIDLSTGMTLSKTDCDVENGICEICLEAKQTRLPFNSIRQRACRPLEMLHTDLCGPIEPMTWDRKSYILTVLDDYTHYCRVSLLIRK